MPTYLARVTVHAELDPEQVDGLADALGAARTEPADDRVVLWVPGEAPDAGTAEVAARRHVAEVLQGWTVDVDVDEALGS
ncbi:hypothetical protein [Cellulomonas aerilata]|uniref:Uncharacterized protein n=1 Tax=Cellulomonas aerilata TaxID=515326 RepID=A0A512DEM4_9CELL|nr:hypothetical protein [Cellulomonas aerilata]GEO34919.1 hypothetical protein CAE01nite_26440 [Cellulomonas aerilata]